MATFKIGRNMLRKTLINGLSYNYVRYYGRTGIRWTNSSGSSKGSQTEPGTVITEEDKRRFDGLFPEIISCLNSYNNSRLRPATERIKSVMEYSSPYGFNYTVSLTVAAYKILSSEHSEEQLKKASVLDWCAEMIMTAAIISDDICDNSVTREGKPCWHRLENVGLQYAVNDLLMVYHGAFWLLRTYFQDEPYYINLVHLFHEVSLKVRIGHSMDIWLSRQDLNFDHFNQDNYDALSGSKGLMLLLYLPLVSAMHMVGSPDKEVLQVIETICLHFSCLVQAKDDYTDCFDLSTESKAMGTDIEEGKCTWLIVNALKLVDEKDKKLLRTWYGKRDPELAKLVFNKYVELQLDRLFAEYEMETYEAIATAVNKLPSTFPTAQFYYYLNSYLTFKFQN